MMRQRIYRGAVLAVGLMLLAGAGRPPGELVPLAVFLGIAGAVWKIMNWLLERGNAE